MNVLKKKSSLWELLKNEYHRLRTYTPTLRKNIGYMNILCHVQSTKLLSLLYYENFYFLPFHCYMSLVIINCGYSQGTCCLISRVSSSLPTTWPANLSRSVIPQWGFFRFDFELTYYVYFARLACLSKYARNNSNSFH